MASDDIAIKIDHISKTFKLPHEKQTSIKSALINRIRGGSRSYERQAVLKDISFEVKSGEFFGIVGRNGSGKSTFLKILAGIYAPTTGNIEVKGKLTPFIELGVGFNQELTGRENVFLNGALLGFSRKEMNAMYDDIVAFAELERFMDQKLKNYSSGMQVRLAFSIAIKANTDILLLDEVLAVGDAAFQQKCFNYFEKIKRAKKTVIIVTHDMSAVKRFCTKAAYIVGGKVRKIGDPIEIADLYTEANIEGVRPPSTTDVIIKNDHSVRVRLESQTSHQAIFKFDYDAKLSEDMYIGISVIRDGITVADLTTPLDKPLRDRGKISYKLDTTIFNGGVYQLTTSLFKRANRELLAIGKERAIFTIEGQDITRGNALKLAHTWTYEKVK